MERFYNNNNSEQPEEESGNNPSTSQRESDVDFNDVFGGPPRRRSSVNSSVSGGDEGEAGWCSWAPPESEIEREKPVFGEDSGVRRRRNGKDFFDDIFGGGEESQSQSQTPRRDAAALQPLASSLPPSFSLPAILAKGADLRTFGSPHRSTNPLNNGIAASAKHKELQNDLKPTYRQSLLSKEFSNLSQSDEVDKGNNLKQDTSITEISPNNTSNDKFHFSIYKWASKGAVPLAMPFRTERTSKTKDKFKLEKSSRAKEWIVTDITTQNDSPKEWMVNEIATQSDSPITYNGSSLTRNKNQDVPTTSANTQNKVDSHQSVEHIVSSKPQSDSLSSHQTPIKDILGSPIAYNAKADSITQSTDETVFNGKTEAASETQKHESKLLHSLFSKNNKKQDYDEITRKAREENMVKSSKKSSSSFDIPMNPKKQDEKQNTVSTRGAEYSKATPRGSLSPSRSMGKGRVKGKVKEFAQIFNQEAVTKPKVDSKPRPQGYKYKQKGAGRANNDVGDDPEQSKKEIHTVEAIDMAANNLSQQDDISASAIPDISFADIGDKDESFHENFTIQVLSQDEDEVSQNQEIQEVQIIDKKVQQWSKGKEGNIRSLLSTLQYVLWPNCGWKPVPLVDIIEGNAVKRSYQRALLSLHPDKLQQKGATSDQKYTAEKVFDILQEAWTQFNMVGAL